ncbi:MAG: hypothetical protein ACTSV0_01330 [Candidatus Freyarchaeota archaeon]
MDSGVRWTAKLNRSRSMREVIDYIDELEARSYYAARVFHDPDSLVPQRPIRLGELHFLAENINVKNFERMVKKSNNLWEIGKFLERVNRLGGNAAEKIVPLVCEKIDKAPSLREVMHCLNPIAGLELSQRLTNPNSLIPLREYDNLRLLFLIVSGLDEEKLVVKLAESSRVRYVWACLRILKISDDDTTRRVVDALTAETIVEKLAKTRNPRNVENLLSTLSEISPEKAEHVLQLISKKLESNENGNSVSSATLLAGVANLNSRMVAIHQPQLVKRLNSSKSLREVGEAFRKISLCNPSLATEIFKKLDEQKQNYLLTKFGRYTRGKPPSASTV